MTQDARLIERYRGIVKFLDNTVRNIALYPPEHQSVSGVCGRVFDLLGEVLESRSQVSIGVTNGILHVEDYQFDETTPYSEGILKLLTGFGIDDLVVSRGVTLEELLGLAEILKSRDHSREAFLGLLARKGLRHVGLRGEQAPEPDDLPDPALRTYREAVETIKGHYNALAEGRLPRLSDVEKIVEGFLEHLASDRDRALLLTSLHDFRSYTPQHCVNVSILAVIVADREGQSRGDQKLAGTAGLLHDFGMARIPAGVLGKAGGLTPREREAVKTHPVHSADVIREMGGPPELALAVRDHHARPDGGGYPARPAGETLSGLARLIAVVNAYDAMTSVRPYRRPLTPVEALIALKREGGKRFDQAHLDAFASMVGPFPPGTVVRLSGGEIGLVTAAGREPARPSVRVLREPAGRSVTGGEILDLAGPGGGGRLVAAEVDPALYGLTMEEMI